MADRGQPSRPDPDALAELAGRERRGKLTVFLGAAPGVGKTYAMLSRAQRLKQDGIDIVVGLAETHGRSETAMLLDGLEALPRRQIDYRDRVLEEFDLDAALARRPAVLVVDELAHTNTPGSRHPKRYQDIDELIGQGIDVWTALNIQHLESLSDLVTRITGVTVRETVPDVVLKRADEVILVDLPPAELIARLKDGKVYLPDNAQRAADGFFKPANLTALRELALRRTADRVDDQMVDFLRLNAIEGPWATGERLLVCVGPDMLSEKVVRTASRLASGLNARWLVVSLTHAGDAAPDAATAQRLDATMLLAERLGAETRRVIAADFVDEIFRIARRENITQIVVGRSKQPLWAHPFKPALPDAIMRRFTDVGVHIVTGEAGIVTRTPSARRKRPLRQWPLAVVAALACVTVATVLGLAVTEFVTLQNLSMLFLVAVIVAAITSGRLAAIIAAGLSFLAYNFFFIQPNYSFTVARPHELFALLIFLGVAVLIGDLAGRLRDQVERSQSQARNTQALYEFSKRLSGTAALDDVLVATASHLHATTGLGTVLLLADDAGLTLMAAWPPDLVLDDTDMTAARWAFDKKESAGHLTGTLPQIGWQFRPIVTSLRVAGVLGLAMGERVTPLPPEQDRMIAAILDQTAVAIDRARLVRENAKTAMLQEGEKLHAALFSSLSHDLRTPLASITGAVTTLRQLGNKMDAITRDDLLLSIEEEAARLTRFVTNLFDMTRVEAGTVKPKRSAVEIANIAAAAVERAEKLRPDQHIEVSLAPGLPPARGDAGLLEQVLFNLLDNAAKYGGEGPISIYARRDEADVVIAVTDQGKGIPAAELDRIFEKFYRRAKGDGRAAGTGLGLSISRGFVEAMGGTLKAESPAVRKRGARFTIRLPAFTETREGSPN